MPRRAFCNPPDRSASGADVRAREQRDCLGQFAGAADERVGGVGAWRWAAAVPQRSGTAASCVRAPRSASAMPARAARTGTRRWSALGTSSAAANCAAIWRDAREPVRLDLRMVTVVHPARSARSASVRSEDVPALLEPGAERCAPVHAALPRVRDPASRRQVQYIISYITFISVFISGFLSLYAFIFPSRMWFNNTQETKDVSRTPSRGDTTCRT